MSRRVTRHTVGSAVDIPIILDSSSDEESTSLADFSTSSASPALKIPSSASPITVSNFKKRKLRKDELDLDSVLAASKEINKVVRNLKSERKLVSDSNSLSSVSSSSSSPSSPSSSSFSTPPKTSQSSKLVPSPSRAPLSKHAQPSQSQKATVRPTKELQLAPPDTTSAYNSKQAVGQQQDNVPLQSALKSTLKSAIQTSPLYGSMKNQTPDSKNKKDAGSGSNKSNKKVSVVFPLERQMGTKGKTTIDVNHKKKANNTQTSMKQEPQTSNTVEVNIPANVADKTNDISKNSNIKIIDMSKLKVSRKITIPITSASSNSTEKHSATSSDIKMDIKAADEKLVKKTKKIVPSGTARTENNKPSSSRAAKSQSVAYNVDIFQSSEESETSENKNNSSPQDDPESELEDGEVTVVSDDNDDDFDSDADDDDEEKEKIKDLSKERRRMKDTKRIRIRNGNSTADAFQQTSRVLKELEFEKRDVADIYTSGRRRRVATKENYLLPSEDEDSEDHNGYAAAEARNEQVILSEDEEERRFLRGELTMEYIMEKEKNKKKAVESEPSSEDDFEI